MLQTRRTQRRLVAQLNRLAMARARSDNRDQVQERRQRTRRLIELGGLVQKSGFPEITDNDRAVLYGALLELGERLRRGDAAALLADWRARGRTAFAADNR